MGLFDKMLKTRGGDHWSRDKIEAVQKKRLTPIYGVIVRRRIPGRRRATGRWVQPGCASICKITGLRTRSGKTIDIEWKDGKVV